MKVLFKNSSVYENGVFKKQTMLLDGTDLSVFTGDLSITDCPVFDNVFIFPGFCDVHVHLREPGFSYKETILSGTRAAAHGGYTAVCSMPNLKPPPDSLENLRLQAEIIQRDAVIAVHPYGTITKGQAGGELSGIAEMSNEVIGFSDDGRGVQKDGMMLEAMQMAASLSKPIAAHCEDDSLLHGGYIHDGTYAREHGHAGISSASEYKQIARDLELVRKTGCKYHVCHISTKESVELIRQAKAEGLPVTCETAPHYLVLDDSYLCEDGRFKMNPPLRDRTDRDALIEGVKDGTVDVIATDHAPHSEEEKSRGLKDSNMGIVGIETAFPILYTELVKKGVIALERLVEMMSDKPREIFKISSDTGYTVFDLDEFFTVDTSSLLSMGKSTPFDGWQVYGSCLLTVYENKYVYTSERLIKECEE